jgi:hypothetical protein
MNGRWALLVLLGIVTASIPGPVASQGLEFEEFHTWTDAATIYKFSDTFRYDGDYGLRGVLTDRNWSLLYLRPSVRYKNRSWVSLHGGAALFYNFLKQTEDLPEFRPWIGVRVTGPRPGGFVFTNYFRLEWRAFYIKSSSDWETGFRGRWQLQVVTPRFAVKSVEELYLLTSIEPFWDIGSSIAGSFGDRFRFNFGVGKAFGQSLRVELNYLFHKIRLIEEDGELEADDHVVRLRFFYHF